MTDRPIIFSGAMVRALLAGRKTQTRRLASSPLARCAVGDRLYVREAWAPLSACTHNDPGSQAFADNGFYHADDSTIEGEISRWTPSIHMPRWASRLTLTVTDVRQQPLGAISDEDAVAEGARFTDFGRYQPPGTASLDGGVTWHPFGERQHNGWHVNDVSRPEECMGSASAAFANLWNSLHDKPGERWADDPTVVALTFTVTAGNIDRIAA